MTSQREVSGRLDICFVAGITDASVVSCVYHLFIIAFTFFSWDIS